MFATYIKQKVKPYKTPLHFNMQIHSFKLNAEVGWHTLNNIHVQNTLQKHLSLRKSTMVLL